MKAKQSEVTYIRKEWVSVEDRLPIEGKQVLVYVRTFGMYGIAEIEDDFVMDESLRYVGVNSRFVTHWMPLPEPPQEK